MKRCPECGNITDDSAAFCPRCGCMLPSTSDYSVPPTYRPAPRRTNGVSIPRLIAVMAVAAILMASVMSVLNYNASSSSKDTTEEYTWKVPMEPALKDISFTISVTLSGDELKAAKDSPIDRTGSSTRNPGAGEYAVKDYVVVSDTIRALANELWKKYDEKVINSPFPDVSSSDSPNLFANYILAFVQSVVDYRADEEQFDESEHWLYPIETLHYGYGDCEDTSILACAIYSALSAMDGAKDRINGASVFLMPGHAMVGVDVNGTVPAASNIYKLRIDEKDYYFGETTIDGEDIKCGIGRLHEDYIGSYIQGFVGTSSDYVR